MGAPCTRTLHRRAKSTHRLSGIFILSPLEGWQAHSSRRFPQAFSARA